MDVGLLGTHNILQKELRSGRSPRSDGRKPCSKAEEEFNSSFIKKIKIENSSKLCFEVFTLIS